MYIFLIGIFLTINKPDEILCVLGCLLLIFTIYLYLLVLISEHVDITVYICDCHQLLVVLFIIIGIPIIISILYSLEEFLNKAILLITYDICYIG